MTIFAWIVVGLIAGWLAKMITPAGYGGFWGDLLVGIVGAFVGGFLFNAFGHVGTTGVNIHSILVATVGAVVFLWIYKAFAYRSL